MGPSSLAMEARKNGDGCMQDQGYAAMALRGLQELRSDDLLYDYTLTADSCAFRVHKALLASVSDYFKAVFRSGMVEVFSDNLELKGVSGSGLQAVVDYIYSGKLHINQETVLDILNTGSHLQIPSIIKLCVQFLVSTLNLDNMREIQNIGETYNLTDLTDACNDYVLQHFTKFAKTTYFKELPLSEVGKLVKDNRLKVHSEFKLFKLLLEWIRYNPVNRESLAANLLKNVRLSYMGNEELKYLQKLPCVKRNVNCIEQIGQAMYFKEHPKEQFMLRTPSCEIRSEPYIIAFGCNNRAMHACILYGGEWYPLDRALGAPRPFTNAAARVVDNFLFVCGGQTTDSVSACLCFNPCIGKWMPVAPMNRPRRSFALASVDHNIYAIGGVSRNNEVTNSVEVYSIENNTWTFCSSLDVQLADTAACTYEGKIYVAAGVDENCLHMKDFKVYDPSVDKWKNKPEILEIKFRPTMFAANDRLYLLDLYRTEGSPAQLEEYDLRLDQWTNVQLHGVYFSRSFSSAIVDDWIYLVGRNDVDDGTSKRYNVVTGALENIKAYPWEIEAPLCCAIRLPHRLLQRKMLRDFVLPV